MKQTIDRDRIRRHFNGEEIDPEYLSGIFGSNIPDEELNSYFRLQWYDLVKEDDIHERDLNHILYKLNYEINKKESGRQILAKKWIKWSSRIAAILFLPLLVYFGISLFNNRLFDKPTIVEIFAPASSRIQFILPDSSTGWLNSNSSLKYKSNFANKREVILKGEAFFDVANHKMNPFKVITDNIIVTVFGTKFNIESYSNENTVAVALEEGEINYYNKDLNRLYSMKPNDYIFYNKLSGELKRDVVQSGNYSSWKDGKLIFRNESLDVISKRLEKYFNVDIKINGDIFNESALYATFTDETLEEVLYFLKRSLPIDYIITKGKQTGDTFERTKIVISSKY